MVDYRGKKIVVIGLGLTGLACVNFFISRGVVPRVIDTRISPPSLDKLPANVEFFLGDLNVNWLFSADLIVLSPGISLENFLLQQAISVGIEIVGDIELFCREIQAPVVAITGSNGKSTVTTLVGEIAKHAGVNVAVGGNIGVPVLTLLDATYELYILELSSFQLETICSLHTLASTILNITEDHMNRYSFSLQKYRIAKLRIYEHAKICVVNADDLLTMPLYGFDKRCVSFGINVGDYRLHSKKGETWLLAKEEKILNVKQLLCCGQHNYINALAALALADSIGLSRTSSLRALCTFSGLSHRFQLVLERRGVRWINDSKATNVASTQAALKALRTIKGTLHLLIGGDGKSADFLSLKSYFIGKKIRLYCFGRDGDALATIYPEISERTDNLEQAMYLIVPRVEIGDVVLLSPACASTDQFKNFEERGHFFTHLVKELA